MNLTHSILIHQMSAGSGHPCTGMSSFARDLFNSALGNGLTRIFRRSKLDDLDQTLSGRQLLGQRPVGLQAVEISAIRGSEGRCGDFDGSFRPLQERTRTRWMRIAAAREAGDPLPPVELIQVGERYYVRDGHHRISVAAALGEKMIEAEVIAYELR